MSPLSASAPATPTASPNNTSVIPCRMIIVTMRARVAPSAMRMPISFVRCVTASAITPLNPAAVIASATRAKSPNSHAVRRGEATESSKTCCKLLT